MKTGCFVVILLFALAMTAGAGPALDRAKSESPVSGGGVMADVKDNDFIFSYFSRGGAYAAKDMQMWAAGLTVDGRSGLATLEVNRDHGDDAGQAIGRFEMPVDSVTLGRLRTQLESSNFAELKSEGTYEISTESLLTFTYKTSKTTVVKIVGSGERRSLTLLEPLLGEIHKLQFTLRSHPKAALKLEVRHVAKNGNEYFELVFVNDGREPVYLLNPQARDNESEWMGVKVALYKEEQQGSISGPASWEKIPLMRGRTTSADIGYIRIAPGKKHVVISHPWHPEQCGVIYGAQGFMITYQGAGNKDGFTVIRGGVYSNIIGVVSCSLNEEVIIQK